MPVTHKFGLKLWSINNNYAIEAVKLYEEGVFNYIELYAVPGSYDEFAATWQKLLIPFIIHAPHYGSGMNLSVKDKKIENRKLADETKKWADVLNAEYIIFHPGIGGDIEVTLNQLEKIYDNRFLIENKPYYSIYNDLFCNGSTPKEIQYILSNLDIGFCMDIGHAIYSANGHSKNQMQYIKEFLSLNPRMFHISDGEFNSQFDKHINIGMGDFPIDKILNMITPGSFITLEVPKNYKNSLSDFCDDVSIVRKIQYQGN